MGRPYAIANTSQGTKTEILGRDHRIIQIRRFVSHPQGIKRHRHLAKKLRVPCSLRDYEHIIRDEKDLQNKTDYIEANPSLWDDDENNPRNNPLP